MATRIRVSTKGQVVLPKRTRERLGLAPGAELELIDTAGGVEIRPARKDGGSSVDDAIARAQAILNYSGPRLNEADWQRGIAAAVREKWGGRDA